MIRNFGFLLSLIVVACTAQEPHRATRDPAAVETQKSSLTIISWNMKHLGRANQNTEAAASLLSGGDLITLQEVNSTESGHTALMRLATQLRKVSPGERICVGLSEIPTEGKERYGYLWKDSRVSYVKANGEILDSCPSSAVTIRLGVKNADRIVREPAYGTFLARAVKKRFVLASVHLLPSGKKPQREVPPLFDTFKEVSEPVIVAGDYNLDSGHSAFDSARGLQFSAAFIGTKTSLKSKKRELSKPYDNFWFKNVNLKASRVINLYDALPKMAQKEIFNSLSDHCPIVGEFDFGAGVRSPSNN